MLHVRALTQMFVTVIASLALSCVGISLLVVSVAGQLDKEESFQFTAGMYLYLALTLVAVGVLIYSLLRRTWVKTMKVQTEMKTAMPKSSALENALAVLVLDYVEERKSRRAAAEKAPEA